MKAVILHSFFSDLFLLATGCGRWASYCFCIETVQNPGADRSSRIIGCCPPSKSEIGDQIVFGPRERSRENARGFTLKAHFRMGRE
jgi:hypothetical protein